MFYEEEQLNLFGHDTWSGKTYLEHFPPTEAKTLQRSSKKSSKSANRMPMCKCVSRGGGQSQGAITLLMEDGPLLGDYTMHSFGEYPREESASLLSQILEDSPHQKYSLSAKACTGILNRAERRGKQLPPELKAALIAQSHYKETELTEQKQLAAMEQDGDGGGSYTLNTIDRHGVCNIFPRESGQTRGVKEYLSNQSELER